MTSTKDEITAIAVEHGYTGKKPDSIAKAIDALADTLAGENVSSGRSIAGAIHALAPYIGGGGGGSLGELVDVNPVTASSIAIFVSTTPYDITSGETLGDIRDSVYNNTNALRMYSTPVEAPSGCYVAVQAELSDDWTTDSLTVYEGSRAHLITSGFECRTFDDESYVFFTMQIPADGLVVDFSDGNDGGVDIG